MGNKRDEARVATNTPLIDNEEWGNTKVRPNAVTHVEAMVRFKTRYETGIFRSIARSARGRCVGKQCVENG